MRWTTRRSDSEVYPQGPSKTSLPTWNEEGCEVKTTLVVTGDYPELEYTIQGIISKNYCLVNKEFTIKPRSQIVVGVIIDRRGVENPLLILP